MNPIPAIRIAHPVGVMLALILAGTQAAAQARDTTRRQPAKVPTIVAQSMTLMGSGAAAAQFFDGETPPGWPSALVPRAATVVGGGLLGDTIQFRVRVAVFDLGAAADPAGAVRELLTRAGFAPVMGGPPRQGGGFVATDFRDLPPVYCRGALMAVFGLTDSVHAPGSVAMHLVDGESTRHSCRREREPADWRRSPLELPTLSPPKGALLISGSSGSSDGTGYVRSTVRSTMPADSVLTHFTGQLVAAGWRAAGRPAVTDGVAAQRFLVRSEGKEWTAGLIVMTVGDRHEVLLQYAPKD